MGGRFSAQEKMINDNIFFSRNQLPDYYIENVLLTEDDVRLASQSWQILISGENTLPFLALRSKNSEHFKYTSSLTWFYDVFYQRFFGLCPDAKPMFAFVKRESQENLMAELISSILQSSEEADEIQQKILQTSRKYGKGIKMSNTHYIFMGEALLWSLDLVIGSSFDDFRLAWVRIYSNMLATVILSSKTVVNGISREVSFHTNSRSRSREDLVQGQIRSSRQLSKSRILPMATMELSQRTVSLESKKKFSDTLMIGFHRSWSAL
eukprot:gene15495-32759_t